MPSKKKSTIPTSKPISGDRLLFKRTTTVPRRVVSAADLWLELFIEYSDEVLRENHERPALWIMYRASELADAALDVYQNRWPNVEP